MEAIGAIIIMGLVVWSTLNLDTNFSRKEEGHRGGFSDDLDRVIHANIKYLAGSIHSQKEVERSFHRIP